MPHDSVPTNGIRIHVF